MVSIVTKALKKLLTLGWVIVEDSTPLLTKVKHANHGNKSMYVIAALRKEELNIKDL